MTRRCLMPALVALALTPAAAGAAAKPVKYAGRTKGGAKVTFVLDHGWVRWITTLLPMSCGSAQGGAPTASLVTWAPAYRFRLGTTAAVTSTDGLTKHYHITTHRHGRKITGRLSMNWSLLGSDGFGGSRILICQASGSFAARPKAATR